MTKRQASDSYTRLTLMAETSCKKGYNWVQIFNKYRDTLEQHLLSFGNLLGYPEWRFQHDNASFYKPRRKTQIFRFKSRLKPNEKSVYLNHEI